MNVHAAEAVVGMLPGRWLNARPRSTRNVPVAALVVGLLPGRGAHACPRPRPNARPRPARNARAAALAGLLRGRLSSARPHPALSAAVFVVGLLLLSPAAASGQTRFELEAGPQYGLQQNPMTPGWVVSGGFEIDGQEFVVEAAWSRYVRTQEVYGRYDPFDEYPGSETLRSHYLTLAAGIRGGLDSEKRFSPFYQLLVGGFTTRHRTDYDWAGIDTEAENRHCGIFAGDMLWGPCFNVPYPEYREEASKAFLMQPGVGLDVRVAPRLRMRLATDLLALAHRDWGMVLLPRMSLRAVVAF